MVTRRVTSRVTAPTTRRVTGNGVSGGIAVNTAYQILVKTDNVGTSTDTQFTLPATGTYDIDWGDGTVEEKTGAATHTYAIAGNYVVKVTGGLTRIQFNNDGDKLKLLEIQNWGEPTWGSFADAYFGCSNLQITASDLPVSGGVASFFRAWRDCSSLTSFPLIDTSSGTSFSNTWRNCSSLTSFPLIDTSSGTIFSNTWQDCSSLTSFPLIDTSSGTNFSNTWRNCSSLTSFPLLSFASMASGNDCFFGVTLPTATWSQLLINTEASNSKASVQWHGGGSKYNTAGGVARAALVADHTWTITDGGAE